MEYYTKYGFCVKSRMAGLLVGFFVFDPQITPVPSPGATGQAQITQIAVEANWGN